MKYVGSALVAAVLVLGLAGCTRGGLQAGQGRLVFDDARVEVAEAGERYRAVDDDVTVHRGDLVRVRAGEATLRLSDQASLLLRAGTVLRVDRTVALLEGDVVALPGDSPLPLEALESRVVVDSGATRVRTGLGVTAGVYEGRAQVVTAGQSLDVPAYRQATISAYGVLPNRPAPLRYRDEDTWDHRFLSLAIEITDDLDKRSGGLTAQLRPGEGRTLGFYRLLLPPLERERGFESCDAALHRDAGETLVGAGIALEARRGSFVDRCRQVFAFRDEGATWGLVALDQRLTELRSIRERLAEAVGRVPISATFAAPPDSADAIQALAAAGSPGGPTPPATDGGEAPRPPATSPDPPQGGEEPPPGAPGLPILPGNPPPPDGQPGLLEPLIDSVEDTIGGLLGGLLG